MKGLYAPDRYKENAGNKGKPDLFNKKDTRTPYEKFKAGLPSKPYCHKATLLKIGQAFGFTLFMAYFFFLLLDLFYLNSDQHS